MFEVTGSPVILESLHFGFTKSEKSSELEELIKAINVKHVRISDHHKIDMCFGYIVVTLPNPSIDYDKYVFARTTYIKELTETVKPFKEN